MTEIERRAIAATATEKRFRDKPFDWSKSATCVHLLRYHAAQMGHKLPVVPRFRTPLSAKKALKSMGHADLVSLMDSLFERLPAPAFARTGDIVACEGDAGFHALYVRGGNTKFLGWHIQKEECGIWEFDLDNAQGAWRL